VAPPPRKKPKGDAFALLLEEDPKEPAEDMGEDMGMTEEGDLAPLSDEDPLAEEDSELEEEDPLAAESIDPEAAALCRALGFTEPDQQQALLDLIDLRMSGPSMGSEEETLPPLPESAY
jgi:hypothetical protein